MVPYDSSSTPILDIRASGDGTSFRDTHSILTGNAVLDSDSTSHQTEPT
jgi:hypothetical protein